MFDPTWNSQMHRIELAQLAASNLHVFRVDIQDHGSEEVLFQGYTRDEAKRKLLEWLSKEPFVRLSENGT